MFRSSNLIDERQCFMENSRSAYLIYALYDAVTDGDIGTVGFLLESKKVDPNCLIKDYDAAPLHIAAGIGTEDLSTKLVQLLLTYGANPNIVTSDGMTPLMIASIWGRPCVSKLLLLYGADPSISDLEGKDSFDYATDNDNHFLLTLLKETPGNFSVLESSDNSLDECSKSLKKSFYTFYNTDSNYESIKPEDNVPFSDIDSEANFQEFCALDTAFLSNSNDFSDSSTGTFVSIANQAGVFSILEEEQNTIADENDSQYSDHYSSSTSTKSSEKISIVSYETDCIKSELKKLNVNHGPVTKTTKKVYYNLIKKIIKGKKILPSEEDEFSNFPEVLRNSVKSCYQDVIQKWYGLEEMLSTNFTYENRNWRGGKEKQFFTYLLLDPFITCNIPGKRSEVTDLEMWRRFVLSIFYVGKGKNSRPFSHLFEALQGKVKKNLSKKVLRIQSIWAKSAGVICLHIFHNVICAEAHTREAAMIDAIGLSNLTNIQSGEYYGIVKNWSIKQKQQLGVVLLKKAFQIYLAEGERQIYPADLTPINRNAR